MNDDELFLLGQVNYLLKEAQVHYLGSGIVRIAQDERFRFRISFRNDFS